VISDQAVNISEADTFDAIQYFEAEALPLSRRTKIKMDSRGIIWSGSMDRGVCRITTNQIKIYSKSTTPAVDFDAVLSIIEDEDGLLWMGTETGFVKYDYTNDKFEKFGDGIFPEDNNNIYGARALLKLDKETMFVGTRKGLVRYSLKNKEITYDGRKDTVLPNSLKNPHYVSKLIRFSEDEIVAATNIGLEFINVHTLESRIVENPYPFTLFGNSSQHQPLGELYKYGSKIFSTHDLSVIVCYDDETKTWSMPKDVVKIKRFNMRVDIPMIRESSPINKRYFVVTYLRYGNVVFDMKTETSNPVYIRHADYEKIESHENSENLLDHYLNYAHWAVVARTGHLWTTDRNGHLVQTKQAIFEIDKQPAPDGGSLIEAEFPTGYNIDFFRDQDETTINLSKNQRSINLTLGAWNSARASEIQYSYSVNGNEEHLLDSSGVLNLTDLKGGTTSVELRSKIDEETMARKKIFVHVEKFWHEKWLVRLGLLLLILAIPTLISYFRVKRLRKQAEQKRAFEKQVAEVEMTALRAQMNPHFLFNSLNSIKNYSLTKSKEETADYITVFSRLVRQILQNSYDKIVSLSQELEAIRLYTEVESKRFENRFDFNIELDPTLNAEAVFIPPLLVQPYVENAIWHGLMHKEEKGALSIHFIDDEEYIKCFIQDDGVGRTVAADIMERKEKFKKKSLGTKITGDRLALIEELYGKAAKVKIKDLFDPNGNSLGTRVEIKIPKISKN